jgi:excisionase family DNA binding protein
MGELIETSKAAKRLGVDVETVRRLIRQGRLGAVRIGGEYRIDPAEIEAFKARQSQERIAPRGRHARSRS